ncbi:hypothetical protein ACFQ51_16900 [Streptomyces kaempferi]
MKRSGSGRPVVVAEVVAVLLPVLVMLAFGLWGLDRGGMWRDEAATFQVARRSVPQIWHLLHHVDAVHGLYYLFMHAVLASDPGEVALRLPRSAAPRPPRASSPPSASACAARGSACGRGCCTPSPPWPGTSRRRAGRTRWSRRARRGRRCSWSGACGRRGRGSGGRTARWSP